MARTITTGGNWSLDQGPDTKLPILTQVDSIYTIVFRFNLVSLPDTHSCTNSIDHTSDITNSQGK